MVKWWALMKQRTLFLNSVPRETYDAIIVDAFGPIRPDHELFESQFFELVSKALRPGGVLCIQAESIWFQSLDIEELLTKLSKAPLMHGQLGVIGFLLCSTEGPYVDFRNPINPIDPENYGISKQPLKFYNSEVHSAAFCLPSFAKSSFNSKAKSTAKWP
ncbi:hypothetical protein JHK87_010495 [Glycine soja]|nr:hypothetical protein JHK87_010495 [Glycine soja]